MAEYTLPDLPYDYGALQPHICGEIMELHHSKHHATYVKGANTALEQLAQARDSQTMNVEGPDQLLHTVLPPALEVLTAWSIAGTEADPSVFRHAMKRALDDIAQTPDPQRGLAEMMFGWSSLSGILLDELAQTTGRTRGEVLREVHLRYLAPPS